MPSIRIELENLKRMMNDFKKDKEKRQTKTPESISNAFNQKSQVSSKKRPNNRGAVSVLFHSIYDTFFSLVVATLSGLFSSYSHRMSNQWKTRQIPND